MNWLKANKNIKDYMYYSKQLVVEIHNVFFPCVRFCFSWKSLCIVTKRWALSGEIVVSIAVPASTSIGQFL